MNKDGIVTVVPVNQTVELGGPHSKNRYQGQEEHGNFDKNRVNFDVTVIGYKKEGKSRDKVGPNIQNFYTRKGFFGIGTNQFQKISDKIDNDHNLHEQEVISFITLAPKESVDPDKKG